MCKWENALSHAKLIGRVTQVCQAHAPSILWSVVSNGESCWGAALAQLTLNHSLNPNSKIFPLLSPLHHLNLLVGDNDVTCNKDFKHLFKRLRTLLLWMGGFHILNMTITPSVLEWHLHEGGVNSVSLWTLLNPSDKQDVPKALELLKHVSDLSLAPDDCNLFNGTCLLPLDVAFHWCDILSVAAAGVSQCCVTPASGSIPRKSTERWVHANSIIHRHTVND